MILALLVLSVALFCWSVWQSGHIPEHIYEEEKNKDDQKTDAATKVIPEFIDNDYNNDDEDPPTVVMIKR